MNTGLIIVIVVLCLSTGALAVAAALLVGLIAKQIGKFLAGWKLED